MQWKQGVVVHIISQAVLLYNTTPIHCTPLPLHPPVMNIQSFLSRDCASLDAFCWVSYLWCFEFHVHRNSVLKDRCRGGAFICSIVGSIVSQYSIVYYSMLYYSIVCYSIGYYTTACIVLDYFIVQHMMTYHIMLLLCYSIVQYIIVQDTIPYHTISYHTIPYYTTLYYTILYYTILYYCQTIAILLLYYTIPYYTTLYD